MSTSYIIQPQKHSPHGWLPCEPHQALSWAVLRREERKLHRKSRTLRVSRLLQRFERKADAERYALSQERGLLSNAHGYRLGARMARSAAGTEGSSK